MNILFWKRKPLDVQALKAKVQNECLSLENYHLFLIELEKLPKAGNGVPLNISTMLAIATGIPKRQAKKINLDDAVDIYCAVLKRNDILKMMDAQVNDEKKKLTGQPDQDPHSTGTSTPSA